MRIYKSSRHVDLPNLDLLTWLFENPAAHSNEDSPIHADAKDPTKVLNKAQVRQLSRQFAHFLRHTYGVGKDGHSKDMVVVASSGQHALPCVFYGVVACSGVYSAASPAAVASDVVRQMKDGGAKVAICSESMREKVTEAAREVGMPDKNVLVLTSTPEIRLTSIDGSVSCDFKGELNWERITDPEVLKNSIICMLYSSGTTGLPKGVMISHANLVAALHIPATVMFEDWDKMGKRFERRSIAHLPSAHIAGVASNFIAPVYENTLLYWVPQFNVDDFIKYAEKYKITHLLTVPPVYMSIVKHPDVTTQFKNVMDASVGAAPLSKELQDDASKLLTGPLNQIWGLTETSGAITVMPPSVPGKTGCISPLMPCLEMRVVDDDGKDVEPGQPGEVWVRGPTITRGYYNNPKANKESFTEDGFFKTGDVFRVEGDHLYIVDRKKELIKYNGFQVPPAELEGILSSNLDIVDAAVFGTLSNGTELPTAHVVLKPEARGRWTEKTLAEFVESKVAPYKRLRGGVFLVDVVPRSPSGKILRKELRTIHARRFKM